MKGKNRKPSITRRSSRERAVQILFSLDFNDVDSLPEYLKVYQEEIYKSLPKDDYLLKSLNGVLRNLDEIDLMIDNTIEFSVKSLGKVVLSVLRLAVYEMKIAGEIHDKIAISEAIAIVKLYGSSEDIKFINGVLDSISLNED